MTVDDRHDPRDDTPSTVDLINRAATQISTLVRDELALARAELAGKTRQWGLGGGLLGGAAMLGLFGLALLLTLAVVALDLVWPLWLAVLVVALAVLASAGVAGLTGKRRLARATPIAPTETMASVAADVATVRRAVSEGRRG